MVSMKVVCSFVLAMLVPIYISAQGLLIIRELFKIKDQPILITDKI